MSTRRNRSTHTLATLDVSSELYQEIKIKIVAAEQQERIMRTPTGELIDMTGIAIVEEEPTEKTPSEIDFENDTKETVKKF
jgi:hypothetical protein